MLGAWELYQQGWRAYVLGSQGSLVISIENGNAISEGPWLNNLASMSPGLAGVKVLKGYLGTW